MSKKSDDDEMYGPPTGAILPDDTSKISIKKNDSKQALESYELSQAQNVQKAEIFPGMANEGDKSVTSVDHNETVGLVGGGSKTRYNQVANGTDQSFNPSPTG